MLGVLLCFGLYLTEVTVASLFRTPAPIEDPEVPLPGISSREMRAFAHQILDFSTRPTSGSNANACQ